MNKNRIKTISLALFVALLGVGALTKAPVIQTTRAFSANLPGGYTGAPGEFTCATTGCHTGGFFPASELIVIEPSKTLYEPGEKLTIKVRLAQSDAKRKRWGFQLTAIGEDGKRAGTLIPGDFTTLIEKGGPTGERQYIEHHGDDASTFRGQTSNIQWIFQWQAPNDYFMPVTFYAAGCQANNNEASTGDKTFTQSLIVRVNPDLLPTPILEKVEKQGKFLVVTGKDFDGGAQVVLNDVPRPTSPVEEAPTTILRSKKAGKKIQPGGIVKVRNGSGKEADEVIYLPPSSE